MNFITFELDRALLAEVRQAVADGLRECRSDAWLNAEQAANHLATTKHAIRGMVKRHQIPFERTPTGRILFSRDALDKWVRGGSA